MDTISFYNLSFMLLPVIFVAYVYYKWVGNVYEIPYAITRMFFQLILIGYALMFIFSYENIFFTLFILSIMLISSTFIMLRNTNNKSKKNYLLMLFSSWFSSTLHLFLILFIVLQRFDARFCIPLAGMVFSSIMNVISISIERFETQMQHKDFITARNTAFKVSLIPQINSLLAVGLVSLPGMMTGQILSGVDPLIAIRYQILIMLLSISGGGLSVIIYFYFYEKLNIKA